MGNIGHKFGLNFFKTSFCFDRVSKQVYNHLINEFFLNKMGGAVLRNENAF
jgi:hypothetical protein